jgi:hypothetical protein
MTTTYGFGFDSTRFSHRRFSPTLRPASRPVITNSCAITLGSLSYQFSKAVTKLIIEDLFHAVRVHAFIMPQ